MSNDTMYHEGMRRLQDTRETRRIADRLEEKIVHSTFSEDDRLFIQNCPMVFVATADADGRPDCSYKGGLPGFVRVLDEHTLALRVNGTARITEQDPLRAEYPDSVFIIRVKAEKIFPACPRYIHKMQLTELSEYAPRKDYTPPVPAWKNFDDFRDALPERDRAQNDSTTKPLIP